jgi:hypothetical protein
MANNKKPNWLIDDVAGFLASYPTREQLLAYRPSPEEWELNQFEHLEMLMQSVKARLRKARPVRA